jgi:hypothetical protein
MEFILHLKKHDQSVKLLDLNNLNHLNPEKYFLTNSLGFDRLWLVNSREGNRKTGKTGKERHGESWTGMWAMCVKQEKAI